MKPIVTIFNQRLLKLANYFELIKEHPDQGRFDEVNLVAIEGKVHIHYLMKYPIWVVDAIILLEPINQEEGLIEGIIEYYNLTQDEFCHIMDIEGYQLTDQFGGRKLNIDSTPLDIAHNIRELVRRREGNS